ncbi:uncharacterized protein LOC119223267 isoform X1 [Pungitius pungitius]|uniref:uncharacterized protein LOC119223267 isoform X1 n=2 Tax=Pungitius pungitius TaxID=134920 RepID=UPI002E0F6598
MKLREAAKDAETRRAGPPESDPDPLLKRTSDDMTTMRAIYETQKWIKPAPNAPPPSSSSVTPRGHLRGSSSIAHMCFKTNQRTSKEDYTTVYQSDFPVWKVQKCLPFKQANSFKVKHGLVLTDDPSKDRCQKDGDQAEANSKLVPPFEKVTTYRCDYVNHPVQSTVRLKPVHNTKGLLSHPAAPPKPTAAGEVDRDIFDETRALSAAVNNRFAENKLQGTGEAPKTSPPADRPEHRYAGANPARASRQAGEGGKRSLWGNTTMKEDYKYWKMPPFSAVRKDADWPKKPSFSPGPTKPAKGSKTTRAPFATNATKRPAEKQARAATDRNPPGTGGSRMCCWTSSLANGGGIGGGPKESHQMISYMISSRS